MTDTQIIKDRIDIVQLIQEYVPLKKAGVNWKANCPFHSEKSPSFMVHSEKQIWHCFGCGKGGDVFSFLQEMEGLEFIETLKLLANRAGVTLDSSVSEVTQNRRNRLLEINAAAAYFFHRFLLEIPASEGAREYLKKRGLTNETLATWKIGYIPEQWDLLTKYLFKKGHALEDLVTVGLTIKNEGASAQTGKGYYDRFRGRIMFPLYDTHGNVVGFTGRVLIEHERSGGKYVNTPQTPLYDKSRTLYGLHLAKQEIKSKDAVILVEGQMDVISSHQCGVKNVVAASGTALTFDQVKLIKRYTHNLLIAFDADSAGENAGKRGIEEALKQGLNVKIIQIPPEGGKDADECIKKDPALWIRALQAAQDIMEWYFNITFQKYNPANPKEKQYIATILLAQIANLSSLIERDSWLRRLAEQLQVERTLLQEELKKMTQKTSTSHQEERSKPSQNEVKTPYHIDRYYILLQSFWALLCKFPSLFSLHNTFFKDEYFTIEPFKDLYELWKKYYNNDEIDLDSLSRALLSKINQNIVNILVLQSERDYADFTLVNAKQELEKLHNHIRAEWLKRKRRDLELLLKQAEKEKNNSVIADVLYQLQSL